MPTIVIAGGTGLLGAALTRALRADGHRVVVLTRRPHAEGQVRWSPEDRDRSWMSTLEGAAAVINLAGNSIAAGRWTAARKAAIRDSRIVATDALVGAIAAVRQPPPVFVSSSAIGVYGTRGDERITERSSPGSDFLAEVCRDWEARAQAAEGVSRVVLLRTGVVLAREGGALPQLALPFRFFVGGPVGSGRQFVSWIHVDDWVAMVQWILATPSVSGPINATAPSPVTNVDLARTLGAVLRRPAWLTMPAFVLRLILGEMADALLLEGQCVLPEAAQRSGFVFRYSTLEPALRDLLVRRLEP
jgi:hypothetical protein